MTEKKPTREADDQAIEALCFLLDHGSVVGSASGLEATRGEPWSTILRRRIANRYGRAQAVGQAQWMYRHFHVRRLAKPKEGDSKSAAYVARRWCRKDSSVLDNATRKSISAAALEWINDSVTRYRQPFPNGDAWIPNGDAWLYRALDRALAKMARNFRREKGSSSPAP